MTLDDEELRELDRELEAEFGEELEEIRVEAEAKEERESTPKSPKERELPTTSELEREAAAIKEKQKTLEGEDADPKKLKKNGGKTEEDLEREHTILKRLGFEEHDDRAKPKYPALKYKIHLKPVLWTDIVKGRYEARSDESDTGFDGITVMRSYSDTYPNGKFSASPYVVVNKNRIYLKKGQERPDFLTEREYCSLRPVKQFYHFRDHPKEPLPEATVTGKLIDIQGGGSCIQILDQYEDQVLMYPTSCIYKDKEGVYKTLDSYNIDDGQGNLRMNIPRELVLPNYEAELAAIEARQASEPEPARKKEKEEPPDYVPDESEVKAYMEGEKEVKVDKEVEAEVKVENDYEKQTRAQVHAIRETWEVCYREARNFVEKEIFPIYDDKFRDTAMGAAQIIELARILDDFTIRIAQGFKIDLNNDRRSGKY